MVSVVVPCRNEVKWIGPCLESILANDFPKEQLEVLVVDGMSDDGTRPIVEDFSRRYPFVRMIDNPRRITPVALNVGIAASHGSVIVRMDAHVDYPTHYISRLVHWLETSGADVVGGQCHTCPANGSTLAKAIALGMSHPLGVGNSHFRIGSTEPRWVDATPLGCFRRDVFDRIGLFDEELIRNQDDEIELRLIRAGGRVLLVPDVAFRYYTRDSLRKLWRMYYQYGYFKPLVVRKVGRLMTARQLVPAVFVLSLVVAALAAPWSWVAVCMLAAIVLAYTAAIISLGAAPAIRQGLGCSFWLCAVFPTLHMSYGLGYLKGVLDFMIFRRRASGQGDATPITR
ncbi:MAG: glycosyltransferase family 2 protein [Planctomycetaceae bacterium]|nr:glycosyltransferase family 2 protein [Planctomycetaceae bacterium]